MLTEIELSKQQKQKLFELDQGALVIAWNDGEFILMQAAKSDVIFRWDGQKWLPFDRVRKRRCLFD